MSFFVNGPAGSLWIYSLIESSFARLELLTNNCDYELAAANLTLSSGS